MVVHFDYKLAMEFANVAAPHEVKLAPELEAAKEYTSRICDAESIFLRMLGEEKSKCK